MSFGLERRLAPDQLAAELRAEAHEGLTSSPKWMRSRWVWDARGAELYDKIMDLPQYYLPQVERPLLAAHAGDVEELVHPKTVVELGPGSSVKTPRLLDALTGLERYVAVDVSAAALEDAGRRLAKRYPDLDVVGIIGDFESGLPDPSERTLVVCLGSTVGNLGPGDRARLLGNVAGLLDGGALLLGLDLVKDPERIAGAYRDDLGHTEGSSPTSSPSSTASSAPTSIRAGFAPRRSGCRSGAGWRCSCGRSSRRRSTSASSA